MSAIAIPETLAETLEDDLVDAITEALAPPEEQRSERAFEIEIESEDEGTFTLELEDGFATGRSGFAEDPLVSCYVPAGGFALVRRALQAWCDGFPGSPELARLHARGRALDAEVIDAALDGVEGIGDLVIVAEVKAVGTFKVARGAIDEATREMVLTADEAVIDRALAGDLGPARAVKPRKGATLVTELLSAIAPVMKALKAR